MYRSSSDGYDYLGFVNALRYLDETYTTHEHDVVVIGAESAGLGRQSPLVKGASVALLQVYARKSPHSDG